MASTKEKLMEEISPVKGHPYSKVTVVGVGQVGMAAAFCIMSQVKAHFAVLYNAWLGKWLQVERDSLCDIVENGLEDLVIVIYVAKRRLINSGRSLIEFKRNLIEF